MDKDLLRARRRREWIDRRVSNYQEIIKEFPDGLTKDNLESFKKRMKEKEKEKNDNQNKRTKKRRQN